MKKYLSLSGSELCVVSLVFFACVFCGCAASESAVGFDMSPSRDLVVVAEMKIDGRPNAIAINAHGDICITDAETDEIVLITSYGSSLARFGGTGWQAGRFRSPSSVAFNPLTPTQIYVSDSGNDRIQKGDLAAGRFVTYGRGISLKSPGGIAVDSLGNVYVADTGNGRLIRLSAGGSEPITIAVDQTDRPVDVSVSKDQICILDGMKVLILDRLGNVMSDVELPKNGDYTAIESMNSTVFVLDRSGSIVTIAGGKISRSKLPAIKNARDLCVRGDSIYVASPEGWVRKIKFTD